MAQVGPPQPPAALAAAAAAALPAIQQPQTTYGAKFATMGDAYEGAYLPFLEAHRPNAQLTPATVLQTALSLTEHGGLPGVYAYQVPGTFEIRTVHRLSQTSGLPGVATPWDGITFAFEGDVVPPALINLVQIPAQAFHLTNVMVAPTAATLSDHWGAIPAAQACVGPSELGDADVTPVTTRRFMPVPYAYVLHMHDRVLTPRQAWQVAEQIIADGRAADCEIFLDFLRAACTFRAPAVAADPPVAGAALPAPLTVPLADGALRRQVWNWLVRDLPALAVPAVDSVEHQFMATTAAVRQELALSRANAEAARAEAKAPKSVTEAYPTMAPFLHRLCSVEDDADLPTFWREHATTGGKKHQSLACLQQLVSARASEPASARSPIVVSVALFERIAQFRLGAPDTDDLEEGISPFLICPQYYHLALGTRLECNDYGMLTSGSGAASMADIRALTASKLKSPRDPLELSCFVGGYSCLLDVLLGEDHGASARLRNHALFWQQNAPALSSMVGSDQLPGFLMRIMRTLQLVTVGYINQALQSGAAAALPDYGRIEDAVHHRTWQNLSQLPPRYLEERGAPLVAKVATVAPLLTPSGAAGTPPTARLSVRVDAPKSQLHTAWATKFTASAKEIKDLKLDTTRPKICLSYHLRGTCFESCREHPTHRALTTAEKAAVEAFLEKTL